MAKRSIFFVSVFDDEKQKLSFTREVNGILQKSMHAQGGTKTSHGHDGKKICVSRKPVCKIRNVVKNVVRRI